MDTDFQFNDTLNYDYNFSYTPETSEDVAGISFTGLYIITFLAAISSNGIVIIKLVTKTSKSTWDVLFMWYSVQNICGTIIFDISYINVAAESWILPHWMCPGMYFLTGFITGSTAITMAAMAFASLIFCKDIEQRRKLVDVIFIVLSIVIPVAIAVPFAFVAKTSAVSSLNSEILYVCFISYPKETFREIHLVVFYVVTYIVPVMVAAGSTLIFLLGSSGVPKKVLVMRLLTGVIYIAIWFPYFLLRFMLDFMFGYDLISETVNVRLFWDVSQWLLTLGFCLTPTFYILLIHPTVCCILCKKCCPRRAASPKSEEAKSGQEPELQQLTNCT